MEFQPNEGGAFVISRRDFNIRFHARLSVTKIIGRRLVSL